MGSCAGRIFVMWLPTGPGITVRWVEDGMSEREPGTDGYDTEDYGTGGRPGHDAIVADRTMSAQIRVVDVNHDGYPDPDTDRYATGAADPYAGT
jgi:hypothetical protein